MAAARGHRPVLTVEVLSVTAAVTACQFAFPAVLEALRRDPDALARGDWWRVVSPLLVQADGLAQAVVNGVGLLAAGVLAERALGRGRWMALYLGAGLAGEAAGYAWEPRGAGSSVGVCGLVAGLAVALAVDADGVPPIAVAVVGGWVASLAGNALAGPVGSAVACGVVICPMVAIAGQGRRRLAGRLAAAVAVLGTVVLLASADIHGAALAAGLVLAWPLVRSQRR